MRYPRIAFHVMPAGSAAEQYRALRERAIDLIIGRLVKVATEDDLKTERLFGDSIHVVAGARNRWVRRQAIRLAELVNEPWVLPTRDTSANSVAWPWVAEAFGVERLNVPPARNDQFCAYANSSPFDRPLFGHASAFFGLVRR